jgi:hypothetical protein
VVRIMLHADSTEKERHDSYDRKLAFLLSGQSTQLTGHMDGIREEVACISDENNEAALDLWEAPDQGVLEQKTRANADNEANHQTAEEDEQKDADTLEQTQDGQMTFGGALSVFLSSLEQDNSDGVVEDGLSKDDSVELRVNLISVEDGKDGDGIGSGESCADGDGLDKGDV